MKVSRILFLFAMMVAIGMGLVTLRAETRQAGFAIGKLQARQRELTRSCLDLQLEVAQLRSPTRLEAENTRLALELTPPGFTNPNPKMPKGYALAKAGR